MKVSLDVEFCGQEIEKEPWKIQILEFEYFKGSFIFHYQFGGIFSVTYQEDFFLGIEIYFLMVNKI